jgi:hypothetical protein
LWQISTEDTALPTKIEPPPTTPLPPKILWLVDSFVQLFLEDCRKRADQEDIAQRVINFNALNIDVIMFRFHADLP